MEKQRPRKGRREDDRNRKELNNGSLFRHARTKDPGSSSTQAGRPPGLEHLESLGFHWHYLDSLGTYHQSLLFLITSWTKPLFMSWPKPITAFSTFSRHSSLIILTTTGEICNPEQNMKPERNCIVKNVCSTVRNVIYENGSPRFDLTGDSCHGSRQPHCYSLRCHFLPSFLR